MDFRSFSSTSTRVKTASPYPAATKSSFRHQTGIITLQGITRNTFLADERFKNTWIPSSIRVVSIPNIVDSRELFLMPAFQGLPVKIGETNFPLSFTLRSLYTLIFPDFDLCNLRRTLIVSFLSMYRHMVTRLSSKVTNDRSCGLILLDRQKQFLPSNGKEDVLTTGFGTFARSFPREHCGYSF